MPLIPDSLQATLPELVPVAAVAKRIERLDAEADQAAWRKMKAFIDAWVPHRLQNEPDTAAARRPEVASSR